MAPPSRVGVLCDVLVLLLGTVSPYTDRPIEETGTPEQKATEMPVCQRCRDSSVKHVATHDKCGGGGI